MVKKPWGNLQTVLWGLSHSIIREKEGHNFFLTGKIAFFLEKMFFQQPLKSWRNDLITSTVNVKRPRGHLQTVPGGLSQVIRRWKFSQKLLSAWEQLIYEKILALDLLGPRDKFLLFAENLSNKPCGPWKNVSWSLSCSKKWEKEGQNLSFTGKSAFFPKIFEFNNLLGPKDFIL